MVLPTMKKTFKQRIDLMNTGIGNSRRYDASTDTDDDLRKAVKDLFQGVAHDLGVQDEKDDGFQDYAADALHDFGVPSAKIDQILMNLNKNGTDRF